MTNLDYLDFLFKSIHSHTAKIIDLNSNLSESQPFNLNKSINLDQENAINFKHATLSPPIISKLNLDNSYYDHIIFK